MIISKKGFEMLRNLYTMIEDYDMSEERPNTDEEIVNDPKWGEIREYAKLVYEELQKEGP